MAGCTHVHVRVRGISDELGDDGLQHPNEGEGQMGWTGSSPRRHTVAGGRLRSCKALAGVEGDGDKDEDELYPVDIDEVGDDDKVE